MKFQSRPARHFKFTSTVSLPFLLPEQLQCPISGTGYRGQTCDSCPKGKRKKPDMNLKFRTRVGNECVWTAHSISLALQKLWIALQ